MFWGFIIFFLLFAGIGISSIFRKQSNTNDYLVAGRSINPWFTALSAVATNNSGFMFIGLIGTTYMFGLSSMWLMVGWIMGDYLAWLLVHRRVRVRSEQTGAVTIPSFLSSGISGNKKMVTAIAGLVTAWFLIIYAAAQLKAGSKALHVLFGWPEWGGAVLGAVIVLFYCFAGGIRASIWTDVAQSIVMIAAMLMLVVAAVVQAGGVATLWSELARIDPALVNPIPQNLQLGFAIYLLGWITAGIGVVGQPHIMVRLMALDSPASVDKARRIYISWYTAFSFLAICVGLASRFFITEVETFDRELALPTLASQLLPGFLAGVVLAGLFAATLSTADSQILSVSAALTQDIFPKWRKSYRVVKAGTVAIAGLALWIAVSGSATVFELVVDAWAALAASLGPLLLVQVFGKPPRAGTAIAMIVGGLGMMYAWTLFSGLNSSLYSVLPGMLTGLLIYFEFEWRPDWTRLGKAPGGSLRK